MDIVKNIVANKAVSDSYKYILPKQELVYPTCVPYSRTNQTFAIDGTNGTSFHDVFELQAVPLRVRPIFANGSNVGTFTINSWKASCPTTLTNLNNAGTWATGSTPSSGVVPAAATSQRRGLLLGDWVNVSNLSRSKFVAIRSYIAAGAGTVTMMGSEDITNWATRTDGRSRLSRSQNVNGVTTLANFTSTTNASNSPVIGVQYQTHAGVLTVMKVGDSIDSGQGTYKGESFWDYAVKYASSKLDIPIEIANFAYASTDATNYPQHLGDAVSVGVIPNLVCYPIATPNGTSAADITDSQIIAMHDAVATIQSVSRQYGIAQVLRTWAPVNPSIKDWGSADAKRVAYNNYALTLKNIPLCDVSAILSGTVDGDGQVNMNASYNSDSIHPNDAGNAACAEYFKDVVFNAILSLR